MDASKPKPSPRYHDKHGNTYDVPKLWALTKDQAVEEVPTSTLLKLLRTRKWKQKDGPPQLALKSTSAFHDRKVQEADLSYPIILTQGGNRGSKGSDVGSIVDGAHRLVKAHRQGVKTVKVVRISPELLAQAKAMEKKAVYYSGSPRKLDVLVPRNEHGDPDVNKVIFATPDHNFALAYAGKKWGDRDIEQSTKGGPGSQMTLREMRPGAIDDLYAGQEGHVYHLPEEPFRQAANRKCLSELVADKPVIPLKDEVIADVLGALRSNPDKIRLIPFDADAPETRAAVKRTIKRMQGMPDKGAGYLKWRLENAPPEIIKMYQEEMEKKAMGEQMMPGITPSEILKRKLIGMLGGGAAGYAAARYLAKTKSPELRLLAAVAGGLGGKYIAKRTTPMVTSEYGTGCGMMGTGHGVQMRVGRREEMEHAKTLAPHNPEKAKDNARKISQDHLREDPEYYTKMRKAGLLEKKASFDPVRFAFLDELENLQNVLAVRSAQR